MDYLFSVIIGVYQPTDYGQAQVGSHQYTYELELSPDPEKVSKILSPNKILDRCIDIAVKQTAMQYPGRALLRFWPISHTLAKI